MSASSRSVPPDLPESKPAQLHVRRSPAELSVAEVHARARAAAKAAAQRRQVVLGASSIGGVILLGVGMLLWWQHQQAAEAEARLAIERAETALRAEVTKLNLDDRAQAMRAVRRLEDAKSEWQHWARADQFAQMLQRSRATVAAADSAQAQQQAVAELERQVAAQPQEFVAWKAMHDRAAALAPTVQDGDKGLQERLSVCAERIDEACLGALRAAAAGGADVRSLRAWLISGEELVLARVAAAERRHDNAARKRWDAEFLALAKQEDGLVAAAYDTPATKALPWQELLPGTQTADWLQSATPGLVHQVDGGVLAITSSGNDDKHHGVVVLRGHTWRHCQLDCEITLLSGAATLMLRVGKRPERRHSAAVHFAGTEGKGVVMLPINQSTPVSVLLIGERVVVTVGGRVTELPVPPHVRSGGLAISLDKATSLKISALKIKDLL